MSDFNVYQDVADEALHDWLNERPEPDLPDRDEWDDAELEEDES